MKQNYFKIQSNMILTRKDHYPFKSTSCSIYQIVRIRNNLEYAEYQWLSYPTPTPYVEPIY